jgi:hypothetical protein
MSLLDKRPSRKPRWGPLSFRRKGRSCLALLHTQGRRAQERCVIFLTDNQILKLGRHDSAIVKLLREFLKTEVEPQVYAVTQQMSFAAFCCVLRFYCLRRIAEHIGAVKRETRQDVNSLQRFRAYERNDIAPFGEQLLGKLGFHSTFSQLPHERYESLPDAPGGRRCVLLSNCTFCR